MEVVEEARAETRAGIVDHKVSSALAFGRGRCVEKEDCGLSVGAEMNVEREDVERG